MSFGENINYLRKKKGLNQDDLAEALELSRQTISRWENDSSLPDVETLIKLCELLDTDMETLVRGNARSTQNEISKVDVSATNEFPKEESSISGTLNGEKYSKTVPKEYDKVMNAFALLISLGVGLILLGLSVMFIINAFTNLEALGVALFLVFIAISVAFFIIGGIRESTFKKENPKVSYYPKENIDSYNRVYPVFISLATAIILTGVSMIVLCLYDENRFPSGFANYDKWSSFVMSIFFLLLSISVFLYIYSSMLKSKFNVEKYNNEILEQEREKSEKEKKIAKIKELVSTIIMGTATITFLILGFTLGLWHPAWIAFPIGGVLTGLVNSIISIVKK